MEQDENGMGPRAARVWLLLRIPGVKDSGKDFKQSTNSCSCLLDSPVIL